MVATFMQSMFTSRDEISEARPSPYALCKWRGFALSSHDSLGENHLHNHSGSPPFRHLPHSFSLPR